MSKTSGFRTIEFKEVKCTCTFDSARWYSFCDSGKIKVCPIQYPSKNSPTIDFADSKYTNHRCEECNGTGTINKVESKLE